MFQSNQIKNIILIAAALACVAISGNVRAVTPPPDGGYPGNNTAEGDNALFSLTTGISNTANGTAALYSNTSGYYNTAIGYEALFGNTTGTTNTATGAYALTSNESGSGNTATGAQALARNTDGTSNTATGYGTLVENSHGFLNTANGAYALESNTDGYANTATGAAALASNTRGQQNTATGVQALHDNTSGGNNTASGYNSMLTNTVGTGNTAFGFQALSGNTNGASNIAVGFNAGQNLTTGSNNIDIGNDGVADESNTIRIGTQGTQTATYVAGISGTIVGKGQSVFVDSNGQLGTKKSSARFKEEIKPMAKASEAILSLRPVTFRYKKQFDPDRAPQFGLLAEEVAKVDPDLVLRDKDGTVSSVRYEEVNAMLLNEFLKEHAKVEKLEAALTAVNERLRAQEAKIDKVNAKVDLTNPTSQIANNR